MKIERIKVMKKQYISPLTEAQQISVGGVIMTSIPLPPDMAPKRKTEVF